MTSATAKVPKPAVESANPVAWVTALIAVIIATVLVLRIPPLARPWPQSYDPTGHWWLSALLAALPAGALRGTKRAVNLHLEHAMSTVMETALGAERDSMHSPEHVAIVAKLIAKSG